MAGIKDVAMLAGVNQAIVSRVVNHDKTLTIRDSTRAKHRQYVGGRGPPGVQPQAGFPFHHLRRYSIQKNRQTFTVQVSIRELGYTATNTLISMLKHPGVNKKEIITDVQLLSNMIPG